ncbi:MAG: helix-turn-helix domain-containing protein [Proteobacteria bacterium]|nr:helix-turn-helix domain-containing protein [Pseudomonadota bacterium]
MAYKQKDSVRLYDEKQHSIDQIYQMMGISKPTLYKYIEAEREIKSQP